MEDQLAAYRARKANEFQNKPTALKEAVGWFRRKQSQAPSDMDERKANSEHSEHSESSTKKVPSAKQPTPHFDEAATLGDGSSRVYRLALLVVKVLLWLLTWSFFIEIGFGAVYFVLSFLAFIYFNTRTGKKPRDHAPSAYSVFNPDCERLDGTFTAEQFEKELRYGALHGV